MREGNYLRAFLLWVMLGMLPTVTYSKELVKINTLNHLTITELSSMDSLLRTRQQDEKGSKKKKEKDAGKEPGAEKKEPKREPGVDIGTRKPDIKEVPRARPKLRPGVVDKVRIKR